MALNLPTMRYEIAFGSDPLADSPTWTDISDFVRHCEIRRGRNHELSRMEAGTCTLLLNNRDRRFDPTWTGGPYGADVLPMRKLRVSAQWGNLLSANAASIEVDASGWVVSTNCTIARSTTAAWVGVASLALTSVASGDMAARTLGGTSGVKVAPGVQYTGLLRVKAATVARSCRAEIFWYQADGTASAVKSGSNGTSANDSTTGWTLYSVTDTAPSDAKYAAVVVRVLSTGAASEVHRVDGISIAVGSSTTWTAGRDPYYLFTGYIEAWPVQWHDQANSDVEVEAVDGFKVLALKKIAGTAYSDTIRATSGLIAYYRLDEQLGVAAVDSWAGHDGTYGGEVGYNLPGALPAEPNSAIHFGHYSGWMDMGWSPFSGTGNWSIEMWVYPQGASSIDRVYHQGDGTITSGHNPIVVFLNEDFTVQVLAWDAVPNGGQILSSVTLTPFQWNHVVVVKSGTTGPANWKIYLNGVEDTGVTVLSTFGSGNVNVGAYEGHLAVNPDQTPAQPLLDGALDEVALYNVALSGGTVADHYSKVGTFRDNAYVGARLNEILDAVGWPAADREIDDGQFLMQPASSPLWNTQSLAYALDLVESEGQPAVAFIDGAGTLVFHDRAHPADSTSGTFGDGPTDLRYRLDGTQPTVDDSDIWNELVYQRDGGKAQIRTDASSQSAYVKRTLTRSGLLNAADTDVDAMAIADLVRYKDPLVRVRELKIHPPPDAAALYPQVLGSDLNARKTIGRSAFPDGDPWFESQRIEGITHSIDHAAGDWVTSWHLTPELEGDVNIQPAVRCYRASNQTISNTTDTALTFDTNRWDLLPSGVTGPQHSTSSNTSRLTCKVDGKYHIFGHVTFAGNATGSRSAAVRLNGSTIIASDTRVNIGAAVVVGIPINTVYDLSAGDYVELVVYQDSGGNLDVSFAFAASPEFGWQWVGV